MSIPADDFMLLSLVNTALRDGCGSLEEFAAAEGVDPEDIRARLASIGFAYDPVLNAFK